MSAATIIYFAEVVNDTRQTIGFLFGAGVITIVLLTIIFGMAYEDLEKWTEFLKKLVKYVVMLVVLLIVSIFIPSKQTIYLMAAAQVSQDIVNSPKTAELGDKILKVINQKLDEQLGKK